LSRGYKQRVAIAQALVHDPEVLILDEPTIGLDPKQIIEIRNLIRSLAEDRTVILSTHILPEVMQLCDKVVIIAQGRIVAEEELATLGATADLEAFFLKVTAHDAAVPEDSPEGEAMVADADPDSDKASGSAAAAPDAGPDGEEPAAEDAADAADPTGDGEEEAAP